MNLENDPSFAAYHAKESTFEFEPGKGEDVELDKPKVSNAGVGNAERESEPDLAKSGTETVSAQTVCAELAELLRIAPRSPDGESLSLLKAAWAEVPQPDKNLLNNIIFHLKADRLTTDTAAAMVRHVVGRLQASAAERVRRDMAA